VKVAVVALLAGMLLSGGTAVAKPLTRHNLNVQCRIWGNREDTAFACDPAGGPRLIRMTLGTVSRTGKGVDAIDSIGSGEPLSPGETVTVDWAHPSSRAELLVHAGSPIGPREIIFALDWRPTHVEVTANADGSVVLRTAARTVPLPRPTPLPQPEWRETSARGAALRLVQSMDRLERSLTVWRTLCAAVDPNVGAALGVPAGISLPTGVEPYDPCLTTMYFVIHGDENAPTPTSTKHRGLSVRVRGSRAVFATTLTHRYNMLDGTRRRLVVHARALLVRDAAGIWRLATIESLFPLYVLSHPRPFGDRELARTFFRDRRLGKQEQARFQRRFAELTGATVQAGATPPCTATLANDRPGDVNWHEGADRARHQSDHQDLDLTGVGVTGSCVAIRTAGPLPGEFSVQLGTDRANIDVHHGSVLVQEYSDDTGEVDKPVTGVVASLTGNEFVVRLPAPLSNLDDIALLGSPAGVLFGDTHSFL
jgi:hypothetical protein